MAGMLLGYLKNVEGDFVTARDLDRCDKAQCVDGAMGCIRHFLVLVCEK